MDQDVLDRVRQAMEKAHAPYSNFQVGALVRGGSGAWYAGCNVENAAFPSGNCAETSAIAALVMGGETRIDEVVVMARGEALTAPCGGCRQRIREFAADDVEIHLCGPEGLRQTVTLGELLPHSFGPDNLKGVE